MPRGIFKEGSDPGGRPSTGRKKFNIYVTPEELKNIRVYIEKMRKHDEQVNKLKELASNTVKIEETTTQPLMRMECGRSQGWREGCPDKPKVGQQTWCVYCAKMEKIIGVM